MLFASFSNPHIESPATKKNRCLPPEIWEFQCSFAPKFELSEMTQLLSSIADWMGSLSLSCLFGYPWHINRRILADPRPAERIPENRLTTQRRTPLLHLFRSELLIRDFLLHLRAQPQHNPRGEAASVKNGRLKDAWPMSKHLQKIILYNHWMLAWNIFKEPLIEKNSYGS